MQEEEHVFFYGLMQLTVFFTGAEDHLGAGLVKVFDSKDFFNELDLCTRVRKQDLLSSTSEPSIISLRMSSFRLFRALLMVKSMSLSTGTHTPTNFY